jgi:hypothetical protein
MAHGGPGVDNARYSFHRRKHPALLHGAGVGGRHERGATHFYLTVILLPEALQPTTENRPNCYVSFATTDNRKKGGWQIHQVFINHHHHHHPINVLTAGAQAFLMDYT